MSDEKKPFFSWNTVRWFIAEFLSKSILIIGSITGATGGFKGIPGLIGLPLFSFIAIPSVIVTFLCVVSAVSGATVFWSSFKDILTPYCYKFIDFMKYLLTFGWLRDSTKKQSAAENIKKQKSPLEVALEEKRKAIEETVVASENRKGLMYTIRKSLDERLFKRYVPESLINSLLRKVDARDINDNIILSNYKEHINQNQAPEAEKSNSKSNKFLVALNYCLNIAVKLLTLFSMFVGCLVVVGMGILTNTGFLDYAGISAGTFAIIACVVAAISKQICQLAFSGDKQFYTMCNFFSWLGVRVPTKQDEEITKANEQIANQKLMKAAHEHEFKLLKEIEAYIQTIDEISTSPEVNQLACTQDGQRQNSDYGTPVQQLVLQLFAQRKYQEAEKAMTDASDHHQHAVEQLFNEAAAARP